MHLFWHRVFVVATASLTPPVPLGPNAPMGWPKRKKAQAILFVADSKKGVLMYDPNDANSSPEGSITTGVDYPDGIAVDNTGALYVTNLGSNTVTVYPAGMNSPSLMISTGINQPYGIGVDSKGDVFVSNLGNNTVTAYQSGGTAPYETISFYSYGQPTGIGVDAHDNVWIACDSTNKVYEIAAGLSQPRGCSAQKPRSADRHFIRRKGRDLRLKLFRQQSQRVRVW
jgi:hypothetical protein